MRLNIRRCGLVCVSIQAVAHPIAVASPMTASHTSQQGLFPPPAPRTGITRRQIQLLGGSLCLMLGIVFIVFAVVLSSEGEGYRDKKIKDALIVASTNDPDFVSWSYNTQTKTPVYTSYYFYNITNPAEFMQGAEVEVQELGPYDFEEKSRKYNVQFMEGGNLVSYVNLYQYDYQGDPEGLSDKVTVYNLPYSAVVATVGGEKNLLMTGTKTALTEMYDQMSTTFVNALKQQATVSTIDTTLQTVEAIGKSTLRNSDAKKVTATLWGGGCSKIVQGISTCGFSKLSTFMKAQQLSTNTQDLNFIQMAVDTSLEQETDDGPIPVKTVYRLWNKTDTMSLLHFDRNSPTNRQGISLWLWGDEAEKQELTDYYGITSNQFDRLRAYLLRVYKSPVLEKLTTGLFVSKLLLPKTFMASTPAPTKAAAKKSSGFSLSGLIDKVANFVSDLSDDLNLDDLFSGSGDGLFTSVKSITDKMSQQMSNSITAVNDVTSWNDLVIRQWTHGDVISVLTSSPEPISVTPEQPVEFAMYAANEGMMEDSGTGSFEGYTFTKEQAQCLFDAAQFMSIPEWQNKVLGMDVKLKSKARKEFVELQAPTNSSIATNLTDESRVSVMVFKNFRDSCFPEDKDWDALQGYLRHLSETVVASEFEKTVLNDNGGLLTTRSVSELVYGYSSPVLRMTLAKDDPRAKKFVLMVNDDSLEGPALCSSSADVEDIYSSCSLTSTNELAMSDGTTMLERVFSKVPDIYHTGNDDSRKLGALAAYKGDKVVTDVWPNAIQIEGGAEALTGGVQYGYSTGQQFPPGVADRASELAMFLPKFILPVKLVYEKDVVSRNVALKRFVLAPETFSSQRWDADMFSMSPDMPEGLLNVTNLNKAPTFLSKPHYRGQGEVYFNDVNGLAPYDPEWDDSYLDVEPVTGKTMGAKIQLQLSGSTDNDLFDTFYANTTKVQALPILYVQQHATLSQFDASYFTKKVYGSAKMLRDSTTALAVAGTLLVLIGMVVLIPFWSGAVVNRAYAMRNRNRPGRGPHLEEQEGGAHV